jgi:signal transduction histidine kinase
MRQALRERKQRKRRNDTVPASWGTRLAEAWRAVAHSLSGRLLLLTLIYVLMAETLILVPSLARYHRSLLEARVESAEIAILPFTEPGGRQLSESLRRQLLARAGAEAVILKRPDQLGLFPGAEQPSRIDLTVDLSEQGLIGEMYRSIDCLARGGWRTLRVIASTRIPGAQSIEVVMAEAPIRAALIAYLDRLVVVGLAISLAAALLVYASLYLALVRPMGRLSRAMVHFQENPDDSGRIIAPSARKDEIGRAERELEAMQRTIHGSLQSRARLAALGTAVAKIQHDLRNMLSTAQLASDRLASIEDPIVQRLAPRLVSSLGRAVALATNTLRYGQAAEHPPDRQPMLLLPLLEEVREAAPDGSCAIELHMEPELQIDADAEQLYRILVNLTRNAAEAVASTPGACIVISGKRNDATTVVDVRDNGAGIPEGVRAKLFQPFSAAARGTGLGLAIARELARGHGGDVTLVTTGAAGTTFRVSIPDSGET